MAQPLTALERAFELARSGGTRSIEDIRRSLRKEGYSAKQLIGPALSKQLRALIEQATGGG